MAISTKVGTFTAPTAAGSRVVTGVGFQPKALWLYAANRASTTGINTGINALGFGVCSATAARACAITSRNGGTTTGNIDEEVRMSTGAYTMLNTFGATFAEAALTSLDADGFTLNFTTAPGTATLIGYLAVGGADITNVAVGDFLTGTATGNVDVTGLGFDNPDMVFLMHVNVGTALPFTSRTGSRLGFGVGISTTKRFANVRMTRDQILNTSCHSQQESNAVLLGLTTAGLQDFIADYSGGITDGFRINFSDAPSATTRIAYLAIKGGSFDCGLETQTTSVTNKDTTTTNTPKAVLFAAAAKTAATGIDDTIDAQTLFGASDATNEAGIGGRTADNVATADVVCEIDSAKVIVKSNIAGTTLAECDATFAANKYNLNWTTADAVATEFGWLSLGDSLGRTLIVPAGRITLSAPAALAAQVVSVTPTARLTLSEPSPQVMSAVGGIAARLTLSAASPDPNAVKAVTAAVAGLNLSAPAATVMAAILATPGRLTLSAPGPIPQAVRTVAATPGRLTLSAPSAVVMEAKVSPSGRLTLSAVSPAVTAMVVAAAGRVNLSAASPTLVAAKTVVTPASRLNLTVPSATLYQAVVASAPQLRLGMPSPTIPGQAVFIITPAGRLNLSVPQVTLVGIGGGPGGPGGHTYLLLRRRRRIP